MSRRLFLLAAPLAAVPAFASKGVRFASDITNYYDRATEYVVTRLTSPAYTSHLPGACCRFISRRSDSLLFSSDRDGSVQAYRLDVGSGESEVLTEAAALAGDSLHLLPGDREFLYFDGPRLERCEIRSLQSQVLHEMAEGWRPGRGLSVAVDGRFASFVETNGSRWRIQLIDLRRDRVRTAIEESTELSRPQLRPGKRPDLLFRKDGALWLAASNGRGARRLATAAGVTGPATWTSGGESVVYLNFPAEAGQLNTLREYYADSHQDRLVAKTTQFVAFGPNADASVFVGASGGKATPYVLLMLRTAGREMTLCEHRASEPGAVTPVFAPNSRHIFFESDRDGKPAIYSMDVRGLVEATEDA